MLRGVAARLRALMGAERVLVVEANAGQKFGPMTMQCLTQMDVMPFEDYGQKAASSFAPAG